MPDDDRQVRARRRATAKLGLYVHVAIYVAVNLMLFVINITTSADTLWVIWPVFGWGIGLAFHALAVFVFAGRSEIIDRLTEHELRKDEANR